MATIKEFEDLEIWKKARIMYNHVLTIIKREHSKIDIRTLNQIKSAAGSVMDNIAEGFERDSRFEFVNHLSYAKGSCGEVQSQLYRLFDEKIIDETEKSELITEYKTLARNIGNFIRYLNVSGIQGQKFKGR